MITSRQKWTRRIKTKFFNKAVSMEKECLTICTVSFDSRRYLESSWKLISRLNENNDNWQFIIVNNNPEIPDSKVLGISDGRCNIIKGFSLDEIPDRNGRNSYHHGVALNKGIRHIKTRFALIVDPDFYIVRKSWINDVVTYMLKKDIVFFGAPWHPRWYAKQRYFPCPHCLFIDLGRVNVNELDFIPDSFFIGTISHGNERESIGSSKDTGYRISNKYSQVKSGLRYECVVPVFRPASDICINSHTLGWTNRVIEYFLPDRLCYIPKRTGYYSDTGFRELGYPDVRGMKDWEEFLWENIPFGFHLRCYAQSRLISGADEELSALSSVIEKFISISI